MRTALVAFLLALVAPAAAGAAPAVQIQFAAFGPGQLDVLPGETVTWTNASDRTHTVTADDGGFASGELPGGAAFTHAFVQVGAFAYHCTIHQAMTGEVDVRRVTLDPLPTAAVTAGTRVDFSGRSADPALGVRIERVAGGAASTVATAVPGSDGSWRTAATVGQGGTYRAVSDAGASRTRDLLVSDRRVLVHATRSGVSVTVTPALPYAHVVLQERLADRFGWWPSARVRLDYVSQAEIPVMRPARVRVALVGRDGWTALATSPVLVLGRPAAVRRAAPQRMTMPMGR